MILFYLLIWVLPLSNHPIWSHVAGGATVFKILGTACFIYSLFYFFSRKSAPAFLTTLQSKLFFVLYGIATFSFLTKSNYSAGHFSPILSYTSFAILFFIVVTITDTELRLRRVLMLSLGSLAFASLYVLREWQKDFSISATARPGFVVGDSNEFALVAAMYLPVAFFLMKEKRRRWEPWYYLGCLAVTLVAVSLGASRGGFLGLVTAFLMAVYRSRRPIRNFALLSAFVVPLVLLLPQSPVRRLRQPTYADQVAVENRQVVWKAGLEMVKTHPFFGVGLGNFKNVVAMYEPPTITKVRNLAHNTFLEYAAELGIPTFLVFVALLFSTYRSLENVRQQALLSGHRMLELASQGFQCGLAGYSVSAFFVSAEYVKNLWLMIFLSACMVALAKQPTEERITETEKFHSLALDRQLLSHGPR